MASIVRFIKQRIAGNNELITYSLIAMCLLASYDLYTQFSVRSERFWLSEYVSAVQQDTAHWKYGHRIEDLEEKLYYQMSYMRGLKRHLEGLPSVAPAVAEKSDLVHRRKSRILLKDVFYNESAMVKIRCESGGPLLRIGLNDYRCDPRDVCQIFTDVTSNSDKLVPSTIFEVVKLDNEGLVAFKSLVNGLFVQTVAPPADKSSLPWKLVMGSPSPGAAERFRMTADGYLYSALVGGLFQCGGDGQMVKGYGGKYGSFSHFKLEPVAAADFEVAYRSSLLSQHISRVYSSDGGKASSSVAVHKEEEATRICMCVPVTSKGTKMEKVTDSPFWTNLFDSFMKSVDWRSNKYEFAFYLGFDKADPIYDTGDSWSELREEFRSRATFRMQEQLMGATAIATVLDKLLSVKLMHFEHLAGAPSQVVSQLVLAAYDQKFDYFYQVNDDTIIVSGNWAPKLIEALEGNKFVPNFGVTGPVDANNDKIFTHAFVHRTHIDIFGHLFPAYFKNWWSDDWITTVYGVDNTITLAEVEIKHNVGAQKEKGFTRYEVDHSAQFQLQEELRKGYLQINDWLKKQGALRLQLPSICGYMPLSTNLVGHFAGSDGAQKKKNNE